MKINLKYSLIERLSILMIYCEIIKNKQQNYLCKNYLNNLLKEKLKIKINDYLYQIKILMIKIKKNIKELNHY